MSKFQAAIKLNKLVPAQQVIKAQAIVDAMQQSGYFPANDMPFTYAYLNNVLSNFNQSIVSAQSGNSIYIANMHEQEKIVKGIFSVIRTHIEFVANYKNPSNTQLVITSIGLVPFVSGGNSSITDLSLNAKGAGKVEVLIPRVLGEAAYKVETSATNNGTDWQEYTVSTLRKFTMSGLSPASTLYVRYTPIGKAGYGAVSQVKSVIVT